MKVLYLSAQESATSADLMTAAADQGIAAVRLRSEQDVRDGEPHLYGGPKFCDKASRFLPQPVSLIEPGDDWLPKLPWQFRRRDITLMRLSEAQELSARHFVKTPREKDFEPGIYSGADLPRDISDDPVLLVSEVVSFVREYRLLVLDGRVQAGSRYLSSGRIDVRPLSEDSDRADVLAFAAELLDQQTEALPSAVTVDVGWAVHADRPEQGWAVVEANMAWFSNIYACDPGNALEVIMRAAGPSAQLAARDRPFVR